MKLEYVCFGINSSFLVLHSTKKHSNMRKELLTHSNEFVCCQIFPSSRTYPLHIYYIHNTIIYYEYIPLQYLKPQVQFLVSLFFSRMRSNKLCDFCSICICIRWGVRQICGLYMYGIVVWGGEWAVGGVLCSETKHITGKVYRNMRHVIKSQKRQRMSPQRKENKSPTKYK